MLVKDFGGNLLGSVVHEGEPTTFYSRSEFQVVSLISGRHVDAPLHGLHTVLSWGALNL